MPKFPNWYHGGDTMADQLDRAEQYRSAVFEMKVRVREDDAVSRRCATAPLGCGEKLFFLEGDYAVTQGHVYSHAGLKEISITGICEWCFDQIMKDAAGDDDEDELDFGPVSEDLD
jgi:hypothetical protein